MPHTRTGKELQVGDRVLIEAVVEAIGTGEDYCNATVRTEIGRKPDGARDVFTLNAHQLVHADDDDR
jgi:hypothetical protein